MEIFAHRGLLKEYPENSMQALIEAQKAGFGLETDLRLTKDGDFIIIHDDDFARLTGVEKKVADTTLAEATKFAYTNSSERIISLRELLVMMAGQAIPSWNAIHLKADSQTEQGLRLVARYWKEFDLYRNFFVFDLTKDAATRLKAIDPRVPVALIVSEYQFEPTIHLWEDVKDFKPMDIVWAAEYRKLYSKEFIDAAKATGRHVFAMSPDVHVALKHPLALAGYERSWDELKAWEIEGICTDEPKKLQKRLAA